MSYPALAHRFPAANFLAVLREFGLSDDAIGTTVGHNKHWAGAQKDRMWTAYQADRYAIRARLHPMMIWDDWLDVDRDRVPRARVA